MLGFILDHRRFMLGLIGAGTVVMLFYAVQLRFNSNIRQVRAKSNPAIVLQNQVTEKLGGSLRSLTFVIEAERQEDLYTIHEALAPVLAKLKDKGDIARYVNIFSVLQPPQQQLANQAYLREHQLEGVSVRTAFNMAMEREGFAKTSDQKRYIQALAAGVDAEEAVRLRELLEENRELLEPFLIHDGEHFRALMQVYPSRGLWEKKATRALTAAILDAVPEPGAAPYSVFVTGIQSLSDELKRLVQEAFRYTTVISGLFVFLMLWLHFRNMTLVALTLAPPRYQRDLDAGRHGNGRHRRERAQLRGDPDHHRHRHRRRHPHRGKVSPSRAWPTTGNADDPLREGDHADLFDHDHGLQLPLLRPLLGLQQPGPMRHSGCVLLLAWRRGPPAAAVGDLRFRLRTHHHSKGARMNRGPDLTNLRQFQVERLKQTYADFIATPKYADICDFFFNRVYSSENASERDEAFYAFKDKMARLMPHEIVDCMKHMVELQSLTLTLDNRLLEELMALNAPPQFDMPLYEQAYCQCDNYEARERQIDLLLACLKQSHKIFRRIGVGVGLRALHKYHVIKGDPLVTGFLLEGYHALSPRRRITPLAEAIETREKQRLDRIFNVT